MLALQRDASAWWLALARGQLPKLKTTGAGARRDYVADARERPASLIGLIGFIG
jgi:hypothetical protein